MRKDQAMNPFGCIVLMSGVRFMGAEVGMWETTRKIGRGQIMTLGGHGKPLESILK